MKQLIAFILLIDSFIVMRTLGFILLVDGIGNFVYSKEPKQINNQINVNGKLFKK